MALTALGCTTTRIVPGDDDGGGDGVGGAGGASPVFVSKLKAEAITEAELTRMTATLASDEMGGRDEGTPESAVARSFIIEELKRCGIQPANNGSFEQPITTGKGTNILGMLPGHDPALADRTVLLSAHYDHLGRANNGAIFNGANDNAVAVAMVLGVACAMADVPAARSVLFALWDAEEPPTFRTPAMGSQFYVANPVVPLDRIDVAIALDLVGQNMWPGYGGHFYLGAELSPQVAQAVHNTPVPAGLLAVHGGLHLAEEQPLNQGRQPWSDYDAFRNAATPVLFLSNGQTKTYHQSSDEMATLDMPKVALQTQYLGDVVFTLGDAVETPVFDPAGADYARDTSAVKGMLEAALGPDGIVSALGLSAKSRAKLESDLAAISILEQRLSNGGTPLNEPEIRQLRNGSQRIMCLSGTSFPEGVCGAF